MNPIRQHPYFKQYLPVCDLCTNGILRVLYVSRHFKGYLKEYFNIPQRKEFSLQKEDSDDQLEGLNDGE